MELRQKRFIKWLCVGFVTLSFILVCVLFYQFVSIGNLNKEQNRLNNHLLNLNEQTDNYQDLVDRMNDYNFLEDFARDNGWATSGNIRFE